MKRLNWKVILYNITEAREQLEEIEEHAKGKERISEVEFQIKLEHAYHHLNFAWNIRHTPTKSYAHLTDENFNEWSKFPKDIKAYKIGLPKKRRERTRSKSRAPMKEGAVSKKRVNQ